MSKEAVLGWKKAEKPFPKKTPSMTSILQVNQSKISDKKSNPFSKLYESSEFTSGVNESSANESKSKLTIKDLCPEDKARIANLIKELAKISDEKKQIEKSLEDERKLKEAEITEILKQQEILLNEKESLLKKFSKTQQKLCELQKYKKETKLPPRPIQKQKVREPKNEDKINELFNPYKASTPKNLSPRSLSPISNFNDNKCEKKVSPRREKSPNVDEMRKIELVKEQIELAEEQKKLKALLENQEEILREKQAQIMIQQQLHLKRLEELTLLKVENQKVQPNYLFQPMNPQHMSFQMPMQNYNHPETPFVPIIPQQIPVQVLHQEPSSTPVTQSDSGIKLNDLDEESLENLANIVYKKMVMKKKSTKTPIKMKMEAKKEEEEEVKNDDVDECLVDFIIEETKSINSLKGIHHKNSKKIQENVLKEEEDLEESKLIEDLFFIK